MLYLTLTSPLYAPDVVGIGRLFVIAIKTPVEAPVTRLIIPTHVKLLDQTPLPTKSDVRRYYFRSISPGNGVTISLNHPSGKLDVGIDIWSFDSS